VVVSPAKAVLEEVPNVIPVLAVFAVISDACAPEIVVVSPAKAVLEEVPKAMLTLAVFAVISEA